MTVIYQITDPHIPLDDDDPVQKNYLRLMQYVTENPADLLVITGDLPAVGQDGSARVYQWIKSKIPSGQKTYVIPGNHDDSATMYAEFGEEFFFKIYYSFPRFPSFLNHLSEVGFLFF